jgi:hypothetical protein
MFVTLADGKQIECDDQPFSEGGEGLLYWDKAGQHVIKLYKNADPSREIALQKIIGTDYSVVLNEPYWGKLFAWPKAVIKKTSTWLDYATRSQRCHGVEMVFGAQTASGNCQTLWPEKAGTVG